jgi:hypothetical protein
LATFRPISRTKKSLSCGSENHSPWRPKLTNSIAPIAAERQSFPDDLPPDSATFDRRIAAVGGSPKTGSIAIARLARSSSPLSPTTQSRVRGDFLNRRQMPAIGGLPGVAKVSPSGRQGLRGGFAVLSLALKFAFPGNRRLGLQSLGSRFPLNSKEGQASGAAGTIRPAGQRGEQRPCRAGVCRRLQL